MIFSYTKYFIQDFLKNMYISLSNTTFWIALGSIATFFMAFATHRSLTHYRKIDKEKILREIIEKIIQPLIKDLEIITETIQSLYLSRYDICINIGDIWQWSKVKKEYSLLVYRLSKPTRRKIEEFHRILEKFIHLYNQCLHLLETVILKEIENGILETVKNETGKDSLMSDTRGTCYELSIGGRRHRITFHNLIFQNKSLDEYIEDLKNNPILPNKDIEAEKFIGDGSELKDLGKEKFIEITSTIFKKIGIESKLKEFIEDCRNIYKKVQILKQDLSKQSNNLIE